MLIYPIFMPQAACPGTCIYCDQRAITGAYQTPALEDISSSIASFVSRNPLVEKQIAFYGGTFTAIPEPTRNELMQAVLPHLDSKTSLRISTHPLYLDDNVLIWLKQHRVSTIELGIQDFSDEVLTASRRGYSSEQAIKACQAVQEHGFELAVQLMPGLPGWSEASLLQNRNILTELKPHFLRLYPLIVLKGTPLAEMYSRGEFQSLEMDEAINQAVDYLELCEGLGINLIKLGIPSNLSEDSVLAGPYHPAFGEFVKSERLIRKIVLDYRPEQPIILNRNQTSLLQGHGGRYLRILEKRLKTCNLIVEYKH